MSKQVSKILVAILLAVVLSVSAVLFVACNDGESQIDKLQQQISDLQDKLTGYEANDQVKNITIYVGDDEPIAVSTKENKVFYVLSDLVEENKLTAFAFSGGSMGAFITKINDLYYDDTHYISVFHSIDDDNLKTPNGTYDENWNFTPTGGYQTLEHSGVTFFYSNVGVSSLPIVDGASYYFAQMSY